MYRAVPITQRDGSAHANENCGCATAAAGIDFHTLGRITSTGAEMRERQSDQSGGTDWYDMAEAWDSYDAWLDVRNGHTFDEARADLVAGRLVLLSVWHATVGAVCVSGTGQYGHGIAVAPEASGSRWLVSDPWCSPAKWAWVEEAELRAGAEEFGGQVYGRDAGGPALRDRELERRIVHELMSRWDPERPAPPGSEVGGSQAILYARTAPHAEETDMGLKITAIVGQDWTAAGGERRPIRDQPDRSAAGKIIDYLEVGETIRTVAEAETDDGNKWRLTEKRGTDKGTPAWLLRSDLEDVGEGRDPDVDGPLHEYLDRMPAPGDLLASVELRVNGSVVYSDEV